MTNLLDFASRRRVRVATLLLIGVAAVGLVLFNARGDAPGQPVDAAPRFAGGGSCAIALAVHDGDDPLDRRILAAQQGADADDPSSLESLGWLYIAKARRSYDPGFYKLAEASADCALQADAQHLDAQLLRGHAMYSMHRFGEAGGIAERLTSARDAPFDHGLLGDVALAQGRTADAVVAYQRMVDLRPGLQAYSRAAHIRWIRGDVEGAGELMRMAAGAGSARDPESLAWAWSQVAGYEMQVGTFEAARAAATSALATLPDHAPTLLARGRLYLAGDDLDAALGDLRRAAELNPLPQYQWALADALRRAGREAEAAAVEELIVSRGPVNDPRTTALFAATRALSGTRDAAPADPSEAAALGLRLAEADLAKRADVYTRDAFAWALLAAGEPARAREQMIGALAEGTEDARLFLHAGVIAARDADLDAAARWLNRARAIEQMLLPSEKELLSRYTEWTGANVSPPAEPAGTLVAREERKNRR